MVIDNDRQVKILEKARDHFLAFGYRGAKLRTIAKEAGVTTGALYHHFSGKDQLFVEVCLRGFQIMRRRFETAAKITEGLTPTERIAAFFDAYVSFFFENRGYYELIERLQINRESLNISGELMKKMEQASRSAVEIMTRALMEADSSLTDAQIDERVILFISFAEGLFQCVRKGLLERSGVSFGNIRSFMLSKIEGLLDME